MTKQISKDLMPERIREMSMPELELLSYEIRDFLIENVSKTGGHLASNLGVVELTLALHRDFDTPRHKIIWDVGHQAYVHKILTGRAEEFSKLRKTDGLSGFPKRSESIYDCYDSGHSSSSISAAYGMAAARDLSGEDYEVIAVIGDGALTGGMAYEALNNAGASSSKLIVLLNDNQMSISRNTGGITRHLSKLRTSKEYLNFKKKLKKTLRKIPSIGERIYRGAESLRDSLKYALVDGGAIFEELGFTYLGPVDGNRLEDAIEALQLAKRAEGPVLVHMTTRKGKGYRSAELYPQRFHGVSPFDQMTGKPYNAAKHSYSDLLGRELCELAEKDSRIAAISAAMTDGTGLADFAQRFPDRMFDVGIAEEHAVSFAAGLALSGFRPVAAIYSTFLQRAYDQVLIDVCMQNLPVVFAVDRAGIVGNDGETHHGIFDLCYFSAMPNLTVLAPSDEKEFREMLRFALAQSGPVAIRYPRAEAKTLPEIPGEFNGKSRLLREGKDCLILAVGRMTESALLASSALSAEGYDIGVADVGIVKPLDMDFLKQHALKAGKIVTLEDNAAEGGFGSSVAAALAKWEDMPPVLRIGWPQQFIEQGDVEDLFDRYGLTPSKITERVREFIEREA